MNVIDRTLPKLPLRALRETGRFDFKFDELSIEIEGGFCAGRFDGTAEVSYANEYGELSWFVHDITLHCSKWNGNSYDVKHVTLEQDDKLYTAIWSELTDGSAKDAVDAAVQGQI